MSENNDKYLTIKDYALKHGLTIKTVYNHIEAGKITKDKIKKVLNVTLIKA
jgi:predicted DNA-binding transcriptional regulator AlpA